MLDDFLDAHYRLHPVNATFTGVHDYDDRLPDWSPEGLERAVSDLREVRRSLPAESRDMASWPDLVDCRLADAALEIRLAELSGRHFERRNPALFTGEAIFSIIALVTRPFAPPADRLRAAIQRMRAIPQFFDQARRTLAGRGSPAGWTARALRECEGASIFLERGLPTWLAEQTVTDQLRNDASDAASRAARAFEAMAAWLRVSTSPAADTNVSCGAEFFDLLLRRGHWCVSPASALLTEARADFDEAAARLDRYAREIAPGGWPEVQIGLCRSHPPPEGYLDAFERKWNACRALAEQANLVTWPDSPLRYVPFPAHVRDAVPFLYFLNYRSPATFDRIPIHDYLVPAIDDMPPAQQIERLQATNDSVITLNHVVHHGSIGHHVQNFYACRSESRIGQVAAVDCASRINLSCGGSMAEGWACYATDLMEEVGFLTRAEQAAEQHTRLRLLARAIVDIELHHGTMTATEAEAFYRDRVGMAPAAAAAETTRNSMFPGTAVMYWLGTRAIHDLRRRVERRQGAAFSLRAFHDRLLSHGSIPVLLIAELMNATSAWDQRISGAESAEPGHVHR